MGIVADQPREAEDHLEVTKLHDIAGKDLGVDPMDPHTRSEVVSNSTCRRGVAVDELDGDGLGVLGGLQLMLNQDGGPQKAIRCA